MASAYVIVKVYVPSFASLSSIEPTEAVADGAVRSTDKLPTVAPAAATPVVSSTWFARSVRVYFPSSELFQLPPGGVNL